MNLRILKPSLAGEIGAQNMLPLFLVDNDISADTVVFWTGFIGQILSIAGSLLGGWALSYHRSACAFILPCVTNSIKYDAFEKKLPLNCF